MRRMCIIMLILLTIFSFPACSGVESDYPTMLMVGGVLYYGSVIRYEGIIDETAVKTVTSYTDAVPKKDGQCNFDRSLQTKYVMTEQGLAVLQGGEWRLFRAESQGSESYAPAGTIRFYYTGTTSSREAILTERQVKDLKALLENVEHRTDDDFYDRGGISFDGEIEFADESELYRFSYENSIIYHDHSFAEISDEQIQYIRELDIGSHWGLTMAAENVSPEGMTLRLSRYGELPSVEITTGAEFWLEQWDEVLFCAEPLPAFQENVNWEAIGIVIPANKTTEMEINWEAVYGILESGSYRLGKQILFSYGSGINEKAVMHVYFDVE